MATYYFRNTGDVNWGTASNWSLTDGGGATGAVPTSADNAYFTSNSGNCTVNTTARVCSSLVFAGVGAGNYSGTFTLTQQLTTSGTNVTLSPTMTIAGANTLFVTSTTCTLTSNGKIFTGNLRPGPNTINLADNWIITGTLTLSSGTYNNNNFYVRGDFSATGHTSLSTTGLIFDGTVNQSISSLFRVSLPITINKSGGTLTINSITINNSFTYVAGTVVMPSSFLIGGGASVATGMSITVGPLTFTDLTIDAGGTITLVDPLYVNGTLSYGGFTRNTVFNGASIYARGNVTSALTSGVVSGTSTLIIDGTGPQTVSTPNATLGGISNNIILNNPEILFTGAFQVRSQSGNSVDALQPATADTTSTLIIRFGNVTMNTSKVNWWNVNFTMNSSASGSLILGEDLYAYGTTAIGTVSVPTSIDGSDLHIRGNIAFNNTNTQITGTSLILLDGHGQQSVSMPVASGTGAVRSNLTVKNPYVSFTGTFFYNAGTLTFLSSAKAGTATLRMANSTYLVNPHYCVWKKVEMQTGGVYTMNEFFTGSPFVTTSVYSISPGSYTITFTDDFEKITKFIKINGANMTRPNQLLVITPGHNSRLNTFSTGIRSVNQSPNGSPKGEPSVPINGGYSVGTFLVSDPNMIPSI